MNILAKREILRYFNEQLAVKIGVSEAIVIQQIEYWVKTNEKKNVNFKDGHYWTFNSIRKWAEQFPFWSEKTTKRILKKLRDDEYLITTSEYNRRGNDKTLWYRINYNKLPQFTRDSLTPVKEIECVSKGQFDPNHQPSLTPSQGQVDPSDRDSLTPALPIVTNILPKELPISNISAQKENKEEDTVPSLLSLETYLMIYRNNYQMKKGEIPPEITKEEQQQLAIFVKSGLNAQAWGKEVTSYIGKLYKYKPCLIGEILESIDIGANSL